MNRFGSQVDAAALGKVAVLLGGRSAERAISLRSGAGVLQALQAQGVNAHGFDPAERDMGELKRQGFARCFIALHGRWGEDGTVQGALELLGIPYTGAGVLASSVAMDKAMSKRLWRAHGLSTPDWCLAGSAAETRQALRALGAPIIVKPAREGSTLGLSKVYGEDACEAAWALAARYDAHVLCEQYIEGEETTCAATGVLGPLVGMVGSVQAAEAIKLITGMGQPLTGRLLSVEALNMRWHEVRITQDPDCPVCGGTKRR